MANDGGSSAIERVKDAAPGDGDIGQVAGALKSRELLTSAALSAVGAIAVAKGPELLHRLTDASRRKGEDEAQQLGEDAADGARRGLQKGGGGLPGKLVSKALGGGEGGEKKTRRLPIQRWTDVAVPAERAYEAWTNFDQFPRFMHRVQNVEQKGRDRLSWQEKIWFSTRRWEGRITERRENDRIAWKTTSGMSHRGVVSFHPLSDNLTRVMVTMEFEPSGVLEKMASGLRFVKRAVQADLARFKAFVEMDDAKGIEYRPVQGEPQVSDRRKGGNEGDAGGRRRESGRRERREGAAAG